MIRRRGLTCDWVLPNREAFYMKALSCLHEAAVLFVTPAAEPLKAQ